MSKEIFISQTFGLKDKNEDGKLTGKFEGVANSGKPVEDHCGIKNLITDIESLSFKDQIPIFLNHWSENIVGFASLEVKDKQLLVSGQISKSTEHGKQVLALADEGFKWELSIGVSGNYEDILVKAVTVNGYESPVPSTIIRHGRVFEVSFCPIGADDKTFVNVFKKPKGDIKVKKKIEFDTEAWSKFACGCGGTAESTLEELEEVMIDSEDLKVLEDENAELKALVEDLKTKLAEYEEEDAKEEIAAMAKSKGIELSSDKIKELSSDKTKKEMFLEMAGSFKVVEKKIDSKFTKPVDVSGDKVLTSFSAQEKAEERKMKARKLAAEKGISFAAAIAQLPEADFK